MEYRNAKYIDKSGRIDCEIKHPVYGWILYTLDPKDTDMTIDNSALLAEMKKRNDVSPLDEADYLASLQFDVRFKRDALLDELDKVMANQARWASMTDDEKLAWQNYRQALLDVPQQAGFPHDVVWPIKPQ